jgi:hypothetical protein
MMLEVVVLIVLLLTGALLTAPLWRRLTLPAWLVRARLRGRPGVPVAAWLAAILIMGFAWLLGERRGVLGGLLFLLWVLAPLAALGVTGLWLRRPARPR